MASVATDQLQLDLLSRPGHTLSGISVTSLGLSYLFTLEEIAHTHAQNAHHEWFLSIGLSSIPTEPMHRYKSLAIYRIDKAAAVSIK